MPFKQPRYEITKKKHLTDEEYQRLLDRLSEMKTKFPRDTALVYLALATGARAKELLQLTKDDFDFTNINEPTVFIKGVKGSDSREIPIRPALARFILKLPMPNNKPFDICHQRLTQIWHRIRLNITKKVFHSLRHTFAVKHYKRTGNLRLIQVSLGHRSVKNTQVYSDYLINKEDMRKLLLE